MRQRTAKGDGKSRRNHDRVVSAFAVAAFFFGSVPGSAQTANRIAALSWEDLPARVAGRLIPADELGLGSCREEIGKRTSTRGVVQYIENTYYRWFEHDIVEPTGSYRCVELLEPFHRLLSIEEAQVLLSASELWREGQPAAEAATVDGSDVLFEAIAQDMPAPPPSGEGGAQSDSSESQCCGTDDREQVADTRDHPWNTVAMLVTRFGDQAYRGTAFLVAPHVLLTSAHNIYHCEEGRRADAMRVAPAQYREREGAPLVQPYDDRDTVRFAVNESYCEDQQPRLTDDYAAIFIDEPFGGIATYVPLEFDSMPEEVEVAGYPVEVQGARMFSMTRGEGSVLSLTDTLLTFDVDVSPGNSGSPVWASRAGSEQRRVIGIAGFSAPDYNGGQRLVSENQALIERWLRWSPNADAYEIDDGPELATEIVPTDLQRHSISPATDVDWVSFALTVKSQVVVGTSGAAGDTRMWLLDSELREVGFDEDSAEGDFSRITLRGCDTDALPPGTYYVMIDAEDQREIETYQIALSIRPCAEEPEDVEEPTGAIACPGDCGQDGVVSVNELIKGVNMALGMQLENACPMFDTDGSGVVTIDELIGAVRTALHGCGQE